MSLVDTLAAHEVLDSRGNPTLEVEATLACGATGRAIVPSGASTGAREALELRDGDTRRYRGKGVLRAAEAVNTVLREVVRGKRSTDQRAVDDALIAADGTPDKSRLGANALLGASLAVARAAAASQQVPFYRYMGGAQACVLPVPMINIINGGAHADNALDFQEFMILPLNAPSFAEALRMGSEVFHALRLGLKQAGMNTNVGDEGGFAPDLRSAPQALDFIVQAIRDAGWRPGADVALALDPAASAFHHGGAYRYAGEGITRDAEQQAAYLAQLAADYPIVSIEDGMAEDDPRGWRLLTDTLGERCQLVGDDVFCTNPRLLRDGIAQGLGNSILVKMNQIGTLSETFDAVRMAQQAGWTAVMSHRSGETEDSSIADLAVAANCGHIKTGSVSRADRTAKYNQLLRIERSLGASAVYAGTAANRRYERLQQAG